MNKLLIELLPYIIVTTAFFIAFAFGKIAKKEAIEMSNTEVENTKQLLDTKFR